jgi:glycosyltransferase involved in cell wall biosynthesis
VKLSVLMITYNHERFVAQAIRSVLMQRVDFDYELVVGDDCSTDRTPRIIREFHDSRPNLIRPIMRNENLGAVDNFLQTLGACRGEYIAFLEGDDYWVSSDKLQKQVDFLDQHPDFSMCMHDTDVQMPDGNLLPGLAVSKKALREGALVLEDVIAAKPCHASSTVLRRSAVPELPNWLHSLKMCDWPLFALAAAEGAVGYVDGLTSVYRVHSAGVWSRLDLREQLRELSRMYHRLNSHFSFQYDEVVQEAFCKLAYKLVDSDRKGLGRWWWAESSGRQSGLPVTTRDNAGGDQDRAAKKKKGRHVPRQRAESQQPPNQTDERDSAIAALQARISAMEASRLWRIGSLYWRTRERMNRALRGHARTKT